MQPGEPFDAAVLERDVEAVEAYYHGHGCPFALVTADYGLKEGGVVEIPIAEGRIEAIQIKGHRKTRAQVIRRALETQVGDVFYAPRIERERQRLVRLGLFEQITFTPRAGSDVGWIILTIEVREARSFGGFGVVGFSAGAGLVGYVDLAENNLGGRGQRLSVQPTCAWAEAWACGRAPLSARSAWTWPTAARVCGPISTSGSRFSTTA